MNDELIEKYILEHIEPEGDYLYRLYRATNVHLLRGRMASGHLQGRLLKILVEMIRPRHILEIGTFSGYSAICLAQGLKEIWEEPGDTEIHKLERTECPKPERPKVYTFEINDEMESFTRPWIEGSDVAEYIEFRIGDALKEAPKLGIEFDMVFIDGDKRTYINSYEMAMALTRKGGFIIADNTLWDGHVLETPSTADRQTRGIEDFNDLVHADSRAEVVILPLRDGLTLIKKR